MAIPMSHLIFHFSPPDFVQPLPDPPKYSPEQKSLLIPSPYKDLLSTSPLQGSFSMLIPSITLDDFTTHSAENDLDPFVIDGPSIHDHNNSFIHEYTDPSIYGHADYSGSDISTYLPPSSNVQTEVSSAVTSDSDLPPLLAESSKSV